MGVSHLLGVHIIRTIVFGVYIGVPHFGKLPNDQLRKAADASQDAAEAS